METAGWGKEISREPEKDAEMERKEGGETRVCEAEEGPLKFHNEEIFFVLLRLKGLAIYHIFLFFFSFFAGPCSRFLSDYVFPALAPLLLYRSITHLSLYRAAASFSPPSHSKVSYSVGSL